MVVGGAGGAGGGALGYATFYLHFKLVEELLFVLSRERFCERGLSFTCSRKVRERVCLPQKCNFSPSLSRMEPLIPLIKAFAKGIPYFASATNWV